MESHFWRRSPSLRHASSVWYFKDGVTLGPSTIELPGMTRNASAGGISWAWTTAMATMQNSNPASRRTIFIGERKVKANLVPRSSCGDVQQACRVSVVNLLQNCLGKLNSVDSPASLRWNVRWSIVEVFVPSLQEAVIDFVQLVV